MASNEINSNVIWPGSQTTAIPTPPPLPKYDPKEEAPMWTWTRLKFNMPVDKGTKPWTQIGTQPKSPDEPDWRGVIRNNVIEYPMPDHYKFGHPNDPKYFWFDTPDYADPFKKLWYSVKWFAQTGGIIACAKASMAGMPFETKTHRHLISRVFAPWFLGGMAASATIVTIANLRGKKDDLWNYLAAGLMMSSILGRKNHVSWFKYTIVFVPLALIFKFNAENNGYLLPKFNHKLISLSLSGNRADHGIESGDLRFGFRSTYGEPGRDVRKPY